MSLVKEIVESKVPVTFSGRENGVEEAVVEKTGVVYLLTKRDEEATIQIENLVTHQKEEVTGLTDWYKGVEETEYLSVLAEIGVGKLKQYVNNEDTYSYEA